MNPKEGDFSYKNKIVQTKSGRGLRPGIESGEDMFDEGSLGIRPADLRGLRSKQNMDPFKTKLNR